MGNQVWAVCKDPGGTASILPAVRELRRRRVPVTLFGNGKAVELLTNRGEKFTPASDTQSVLSQHSPPRVLLTSMCGDGGVGRDLVPLLWDQSKIVAVQDFWGAQLLTSWSDQQYRPHVICVNDRVGSELVEKAWPDFHPSQVIITGYPALDKYVNYDATKADRATRDTLDITLDEYVILFGGQLEGSGAMLSELIEALNVIGTPITLIARPHPRMSNDAPEEMTLWSQSLRQRQTGRIVDSAKVSDVRALISTASLVVSMYSTMLVEAAVMRRDNISLLYPKVGAKQLCESTGGLMSDFPLVTLGCSQKAEHIDQLIQLIRRAINTSLALRADQERTFRLDGHNSSRVADLIASLM